MKAYEFQQVGGPLVAVTKPIPTPGHGQVRIKVHACGICHSDSLSQYNVMGAGFPRVPGHEVAGEIDEVGEGVHGLKKGERVGVGWFHEGCGECRTCTYHDQPVCCLKSKATGVHVDGGYAQYMLATAGAVAHIPDELSYADAGPLMCAGITTFNSLRNAGAIAGDVCVVVGLGGLGHLGIQFSHKMGFTTVAVSRGSEKKDLAVKLGANHFIDGSKQNIKDEILKLGGAKVVLWTATSGDGMDDYVNSLDLGGTIIIVAALSKPVPVQTLSLLTRNAAIKGWASGDSRHSQDCLHFSALLGVRPMIEKFPFKHCNDAYQRMMSTQAKFRVVLEGWD